MADQLGGSYSVPGPSAWFAIVAGMIVMLAAYIMLTLLGAGFGAMTFTSRAAPGVLNWGAFFWWAMAGIVAAFAGGCTAGYFSGARNVKQAQMFALLAWALMLVFVSAMVTMAAANAPSIFRQVAGPAAVFLAQIDTGNVNPRVAEAFRQSASVAALASFVALIFAMLASLLGGRIAASGGLPFQLPRFTITRSNSLNR